MNKTERLNVYLAAPLFNEQERAFNNHLDKIISAIATVFLPQRDGELLIELLSKGYSPDESKSIIYTKDTLAIERCDILVAVLNGRTIDEGVAFEIGFARALGKLCIGFKNDDRTLLHSGDNPMIELGCQKQCDSEDSLITIIKECADAPSYLDNLIQLPQNR
ncbi:MAG: nucleoside 2-deoxyribosyltransferase [Candidatus Thiodiazotropha taylori]|nr:nucleoside 2-deoxyribosyltransferase [Candidatus Thiodiazotropha taylori]